MISHIPPQDIPAEKAVLGAMLIEPATIPEVVSSLSPQDFYYDSHRKVYEAMLAIWNRQEPVDLITVSGALGDQVLAADMAAMADNAFPSHVQAHAQAVKEATQKRDLLDFIRQAEADLYEPTEDSLSIAGRLGSALSHFQDGGPKGFVHVGEVVNKTLKQVELAHERKSLVTGIPTGLTDFDLRIGGIQPGTLTVLAGRASMGKTALAVTISKNAAVRGDGVAFITAESPAPKIVQRMLAEASGIENRNLLRGKVTDAELTRLTAQATCVGNLPLWLLDSDRSWDRIKAKLRSLKLRESNLALVVLDHVGILSAPVPKGERYLEIGRISSESKGIAIELELGIVLLSQLNREVESRTGKRPRLSDLRESGCLEQDGDVVGLLYREAYYNENENAPYSDLAELNIAKNRDGRTGVIKLRFQEETVSFTDWTDHQTTEEFRETSDSEHGGINPPFVRG